MFELIVNLLWAGVEGLFYFAFGDKEKKVVDGCKPCYELKDVNGIKDGKHLTQIIRKLRKQLVLCSFKETTHTYNNTSGEFLKLPITAPWPDYIEHSFQCNECQVKYKLSAEILNVGTSHKVQGALQKH